ncbi:MAG: hypothetical protein ACLGHL_01150 [Actinomycetota bacterium]
MPPEPNIDPIALLKGLSDGGVDFVLIGGIAGTLWGSPLPTTDLDITPERSEANLARLAQVLTAIRAVEWAHDRGDYVERDWSAEMLKVDKVWLLGTDHGDLDLVFEPSGVGGYAQLSKRSEWMSIAGLRVQVMALEDLIMSKEAAGRQRDREALPTLLKLLDKRRLQ